MFTAISTASAHANLIKSVPGQDEVLKVSPDQVILAFSEIVEAEGAAISIYDGKGEPLDIGPPDLMKGDASRIFVKLPPLANGSYTVVWSLLSEDGHPVSGTYLFSVGEKSAQVIPPSVKKASLQLDGLLVPLRFLAEALMVLVGGLYLIRWLVQKKGISSDLPFSNRYAVYGWFFLMFCLFAEGFIYTKSLAGGNIDLSLQSPFIMMILAQLFLLIALAIPGMGEGWYGTVWLLVIGSLAFGGHAWGIQPLWVSMILRLLHVWMIALWLGSLLYFLLSFYKKGDGQTGAIATLRPFFLQMLLIASIGSIGSGILMGSLQTDWLQLLQNGSLWALLLKNKLVLVVLMLLLAVFQTFRWRQNTMSLSRGLVTLELTIGIAAILLGVWMSQTTYAL